MAELSLNRCNMLVDHWRATLSRNTVSSMRHTLRRLLLYLQEYGAPRELANLLKHVPPYEARQRKLNDQEILVLLETAAPWMRCFLLICLTTALRSGEARRLAPCHYDSSSEDGPMIRGLRVKNKHDHAVPVTLELAKILDQVKEPKDSTRPYIEILKGQPPGQPLTFTNLVWHFRHTLERAGIVGVRMHDLRRTALTRAYLESDRDLVAVQRLAGHASIATTAHYLQHMDQAALRPLAEKLVPFRKRLKKKSGES